MFALRASPIAGPTIGLPYRQARTMTFTSAAPSREARAVAFPAKSLRA